MQNPLKIDSQGCQTCIIRACSYDPACPDVSPRGTDIPCVHIIPLAEMKFYELYSHNYHCCKVTRNPDVFGCNVFSY